MAAFWSRHACSFFSTAGSAVLSPSRRRENSAAGGGKERASVAAPQRRHPKPGSCYLWAFLNNPMGSGNCSAAALFYNSIQSSWALKGSIIEKDLLSAQHFSYGLLQHSGSDPVPGMHQIIEESEAVQPFVF